MAQFDEEEFVVLVANDWLVDGDDSIKTARMVFAEEDEEDEDDHDDETVPTVRERIRLWEQFALCN